MNIHTVCSHESEWVRIHKSGYPTIEGDN